MSDGMSGSEILRIAAEIRAHDRGGAARLQPHGRRLLAGRVPHPDAARERRSREALRRGETNYPPSNGVAALREAVRRFYERELGLEYPRRVGAHHRRFAAR